MTTTTATTTATYITVDANDKVIKDFRNKILKFDEIKTIVDSLPTTGDATAELKRFIPEKYTETFMKKLRAQSSN